MYEKYAHRVYARCRYLLRDDDEAQDAMHDVFIKVQKNLSEFRGDASPITWMTRIATNHCLNIIRAKKAAWHEKYRQEVKTMPRSDDRSLALPEQKQLLALCMDKLDKKTAEAAIYYFVDGMTQAEVSDLVGMSAPTLRKRLRDFVRISREEIKKVLPDAEFLESPI
jgi:RNA polymerase sigma-70 factor (ECF subfamily)